MQDMYRYYRFAKLRIRVFSGILNSDPIGVLAYAAGINTTPVNLTDFENEHMVAFCPPRSTHTEYGSPPWLTLPRAALAGLTPWYFTEGGGTVGQEQVGDIWFHSATLGTSDVVFEVDLTVEFKEALDPDTTMARRLRRMPTAACPTHAQVITPWKLGPGSTVVPCNCTVVGDKNT
jgi:hypothetical protein